MSEEILAQKRKYKIDQLPDAGGLAIPPNTPYKMNGRRFYGSRDWLLMIQHCPYCRKQHVHGWGANQKNDIQSRQAHCGAGEYAIYETGLWGDK